MQGLWKFITHKSTPKELLMYFHKTKKKFMRETWDTTWSLLTILPNKYLDIHLHSTAFFDDHLYFFKWWLQKYYRPIRGMGEIDTGKQKKIKGKQVTESCSRIFHGVYWPVSSLGNKHCPLLGKEYFEIPKFNRFWNIWKIQNFLFKKCVFCSN